MTGQQVFQRKRSAGTILLSSVILGLAYPMVADNPEDWSARLNGLLIGFFGGIAIIFFELYVFFLPRRIYSFTFILISKILTYTLTFIFLIVLIISLTRSTQKNMSLIAYFKDAAFRHFLMEEDFHIIALYTLLAVIVVITTRQFSRKMGPGELFNFIIGKYHKPKREHRIFLTIDLQNSTGIAENLGELKYHEFLKRYFYDLTYSIAANQGQIYRYVGDQIMISWLLSVGLKNNHALQCFFNAQEFMIAHENFYVQHFGIAPKFRGVLDMGEVLTAEIGLDKQQTVFYGDVMHRMPAIEKICKDKQQDILLSEYLAAPLRQRRDTQFDFCTTLHDETTGTIQLLTAKPVAGTY
ncbi:MAG: hypothetical protein JNM57_15075 [Cyclobacteriaceae bacterium]|nr:hypothetical protein [Cyclobacteriaceae bacterium]